MNTFATSTRSATSSGSTSTVVNLQITLLAALLLLSLAGALYFGLVAANAAGFYVSIGVGALTVDPLLARFRRDQSW